MEQLLINVGIVTFTIGGFVGMVLIWMMIEGVIENKFNPRKRTLFAMYLLFILLYDMATLKGNLIMYDKPYLMAVHAGLYGYAIYFKLKKLKQNERYSF